MNNTQNKGVIRQLTKKEIDTMVSAQFVTEHVKERLSRQEEYIRLGLDNNNFIAGFEVDKGHVGGNEYHLITTTGLIKIYNKHSAKLITILGARGETIWRYFASLNLIPMPKDAHRVMKMCYAREETNPIHHK